MRRGLETEIAEMVGKRKKPLAGLEGTLLIAYLPKTCGQVDERREGKGENDAAPQRPFIQAARFLRTFLGFRLNLGGKNRL